MSRPQLIGIDWGTTSLRAYLIDDQEIALDRRVSAKGILAVPAGGFEEALGREIADWHRQHGPLPVILSGMIGSRQGWREAAYVNCPAALGELAAHLVRLDESRLGAIAIVPGLMVDAAGVPDVMRGEETQILGALASGSDQTGRFVLPGTHSKWVHVEDGRIMRFATYMTGEIYAALRDHTILGRLMRPGAPGSPKAFRAGVEAGAAEGGPGDLLNRLFAARTLALFERIAGEDVASYLSGILIGAELADAASAGSRVTIIGSEELAERYETASAMLGIETVRAKPDCVVHGHVAIARAGGLL